VICQSLGDAFEDMVQPQIVGRDDDPQVSVYHSLKFETESEHHELDFVIISPDSLEIVSAKLDPSQVDPPSILK
jgi:hypothetical protein